MCRMFAAVLFILLIGGRADAACNMTSMTGVAGTTVNAGTYTGSTLTVPVSITFTINIVGNNGNCSGSVAFQGAAATPRMLDGGGHILNYSLLGYYSTTPGARGFFNIANPNTGSLTLTLTSSMTIAAGQNGSTGTPNGSYQDLTVSLVLFQPSNSNTVKAALPLTIVAVVANPTTCTIGGSASGGTQTLDFSNGATISTAQQFAVFGAVTCNNPATLLLTSSNGAAKSVAAAPGGYANFFDYIATTTINGGTVTLNTSTAPASAGPESATGRIAATTTTAAPLSIGVTPLAPPQPLVAGTYADVLVLTITPD